MDSLARYVVPLCLLAVAPECIAQSIEQETQQIRLAAPAEWDYFGNDVAVAGEWAIVGAWGRASAHFFRAGDDGWVETQEVTHSPGREFAADVEIVELPSGDHFAFVGAAKASSDVISSGVVFVYQLVGETWLETQQLVSSDAEVGDDFGSSISVSGRRLLIGAEDVRDGHSYWGAAYVYRYDGRAWVEVRRLQPDGLGTMERFGSATCIWDDLAIVGTRYQRAFIYRHDGASWIEEKELASSRKDDYFGLSLAIGTDIAVVGAAGDNARGAGAGAAYVYRHDSQDWQLEVKLTAFDGQADHHFAAEIALEDDLLAISASGWGRSPWQRLGAVYTYRDRGRAWPLAQLLTASDGTTFAQMRAVDLDGPSLLTGAHLTKLDGVDNAGSAYEFDVPTLVFRVAPQRANPGDSVTLECWGGKALTPALLLLREYNGQPVWRPILSSPFDPGGAWSLVASIPTSPAIAGAFTLEVLGIGGYGELLTSNPQLLQVLARR